MDYLRRLQPSRAEPAGAARPDLGSRYAPARPGGAAGQALGSRWLEPIGPADPAAVADPQVPAASRRGPAAANPLPAGPVAAAAEHNLAADPQRRAAAAPQASAAAAKLVAGDSAARDASTQSHRQPTRAPAAAGEAPPRPDTVAALPLRPAAVPTATEAPPDLDAGRAAPGPRFATEAAAPTHPLRAASLPAPPSAAPPVVHVTIDRIDVRLPPAAAAPGPARRARPAAATPTLADYLRGPAAMPGPR